MKRTEKDRNNMGGWNMAKIKRAFQAKLAAREVKEIEYRGFQVSGSGGRWYVGKWQTIYASKAAALAAVDTCLSLRAELAVA
jgi:hypothetical protein